MGTTDTLPQQPDAMLRAHELRWTLEPHARLEDLRAEDLINLDPVDLLAYGADCREDLRAVRETLSAALALVARQQDQLTRAARLVEYQRQQLRRAQQEQAAA